MGAVNTSYTFSNNDTITSAKMNNIIDDSFFTSSAILGTTLEVAGGQLKVSSQGITSNEIGARAVTYGKIQLVSSMKALGNVTGSSGSAAEISILDEDDMASNSATALTTQQSVKAYVDTKSATFTRGTAIATTSGTNIDFASIPSTVKRITVMLSGVSNIGNTIILQLGDTDGFEVTGYLGASAKIKGTPSVSSMSSGIIISDPGGADVFHGAVTLLNLSGNTWVATVSGSTNSSDVYSAGASKTLSATLDRVRLTSVSGTSAFDAGIVNIMYE